MINFAKKAATKTAAVFISGAIGAAILPSAENMVKGDLSITHANAGLKCWDKNGKRVVNSGHSNTYTFDQRIAQGQRKSNQLGEKLRCEVTDTQKTPFTVSPKENTRSKSKNETKNTRPKTKAPKVRKPKTKSHEGVKGRHRHVLDGKTIYHDHKKDGTCLCDAHKKAHGGKVSFNFDAPVFDGKQLASVKKLTMNG